MSFWDHLEELRGNLFRSLAAFLVCAVSAFCFKKLLFDGIVLAPVRPDFITYRLLGIDFKMSLVNIEISTQFFVHLKVAAAAGLIICFPYIVFELWRFVAPGLYKNERRAISGAFGFAGALFYIGVLVGYFLVLPICLEFFADYSVSDSVENKISLTSYISLFMSMVLMIGVVFEFPTVVLVLSKLGLITRGTLKKYRRHAIVAVLILSAIITPADPGSMLVLAAPLYLLYEFSILICRKDDESEGETDAGKEAGEK